MPSSWQPNAVQAPQYVTLPDVPADGRRGANASGRAAGSRWPRRTAAGWGIAIQQPGSFWLNELAESFEWDTRTGCWRRWLTGSSAARSGWVRAPWHLPSF